MNFDVQAIPDDPEYSELRTNFIYLHNSNAGEVIFSPGAVTTFRTTGGVLDMVIGTGEEHDYPGQGQPEVMINQYTDIVGKPLRFWDSTRKFFHAVIPT